MRNVKIVKGAVNAVQNYSHDHDAYHKVEKNFEEILTRQLSLTGVTGLLSVIPSLFGPKARISAKEHHGVGDVATAGVSEALADIFQDAKKY